MADRNVHHVYLIATRMTVCYLLKKRKTGHLLYLLPSVCFCFCRSVVRLFPKQPSNNHHHHHGHHGATGGNGTGSNKDMLTVNSNASIELQLRSRRKAAKMLVVVVIVFAVCYFPVHLVSILR